MRLTESFWITTSADNDTDPGAKLRLNNTPGRRPALRGHDAANQKRIPARTGGRQEPLVESGKPPIF